jgi:hypothetical protein
MLLVQKSGSISYATDASRYAWPVDAMETLILVHHDLTSYDDRRNQNPFGHPHPRTRRVQYSMPSRQMKCVDVVRHLNRARLSLSIQVTEPRILLRDSSITRHPQTSLALRGTPLTNSPSPPTGPSFLSRLWPHTIIRPSSARHTAQTLSYPQLRSPKAPGAILTTWHPLRNLLP